MPSTATLLTPWDLLGIAVAAAVFVVVAAVLLVAARRAGSRSGGEPEGIDRRRFLERGAIGLFGAALAGVVTSSVDYVARSGGGGSRYRLGPAADLADRLRTTGTPYYDPVGGFYVVAYPPVDLTAAERAYPPAELAGMRHGFVALDQACTHLGCHVPFCSSSRWFECPCHGSRFNEVGELRRGPAPRGLDRYEVVVDERGEVVVDTRRKLTGPPPGVDTTGQRPAGPHCG